MLSDYIIRTVKELFPQEGNSSLSTIKLHTQSLTKEKDKSGSVRHCKWHKVD